MILYPPKVSSEHFVVDVGTPRNHHRNNSKVIYFRKTLARTYRNYSENFSSRTYARKGFHFFMTDDSMTLKIVTSCVPSIRAQCAKSFCTSCCKDTKFLRQIQIFQEKNAAPKRLFVNFVETKTKLTPTAG